MQRHSLKRRLNQAMTAILEWAVTVRDLKENTT